MTIKERQAVTEAARLLVKNGLGDWRINLKSVTSYNAQVRYRQKILIINTKMITVASKDEFTGIMYHEIAHALVGPGHGHGRKFKDKVYELTGSYKYAGYSSRVGAGNFLSLCTGCGFKGEVSSPRARWCNRCFSPLQITANPMEEVAW